MFIGKQLQRPIVCKCFIERPVMECVEFNGNRCVAEYIKNMIVHKF